MPQPAGLSRQPVLVHPSVMPDPASDATTVLYNADCPICSFEIGVYRRHSEAKALPLRFEGLDPATLARWGLTQDAALRRLHVIKGTEIHHGIPAFLVLWREMPRYRWLARLVDRPILRPAAILLYDHLVAPTLYALHVRRNRGRLP